MSRRLTALGALAATLPGLLVTPSAAAAQADGPSTGRIVWAPCPEAPEDRTLDCGRITLPVDWDEPGGATVEVVLARRSAAALSKQRIGVLFYGQGALGGSGVDAVTHDPRLFSAETRRRFDVIAMDVRGTGRSNPVLCDAALYPANAPVVPATETEYTRTVEAYQAYTTGCRALTGPVFDHMDSRSVARDMDAVRAALGERHLSFYGDSFGTLTGQAYAELFPTRLRAAVWESNLDHTVDLTRWVAERSAAVEDSFRGFADWCDRTPTCPGRADGTARWYDRLHARAERGELTATVPGAPPFTLDGYLLSSQVSFFFFQRRWAELSACLAQVAADRTGCLFGDGQDVAASASGPSTIHHPQSAAFCADYRMRVRGAADVLRLRALATAVAPHTRLGAVAWSGVTDCLGMTGPAKNPQGPLRLGDDAPTILLTNSRHDPSSPHQWAERVARQAGPKARLLTYEGWGHGIYGVSDCVRTRVDRYLADPRTAVARRTSCPAVQEP
ncbi:alpha/beta hydrolase [Streptomyces althioticus]|uniref:Alpha/beta hydrolase n=1 Tax=Streptomyces althioticus TaxID=83380 RepID=A0ABZ1XYE9_9ACTN|nr:peptidase [Streptomyces griseorubens]